MKVVVVDWYGYGCVFKSNFRGHRPVRPVSLTADLYDQNNTNLLGIDGGTSVIFNPLPIWSMWLHGEVDVMFGV
jgi:hypothetical protein